MGKRREDTIYVGGSIGTRLLSSSAVIKIPIHPTDYAIILGVEGELIAVGLQAIYESKRLKIGGSAIIGGYFVF